MTPALRYLLDENLRGPLWRAILRHNLSDPDHAIDALPVGDPAAPPLGTKDGALITWAARHDRIVVSHDRRTLVALLAKHLASGHTSPGVMLVPKPFSIPYVVETLATAAHASEPSEWRDMATYI